MSGKESESGRGGPGEADEDLLKGVASYLVGLGLAAALTAISFAVGLERDIFWQPGVAIGLAVLAFAQMGVHLVFFLHLTTGQDHANNALAVAFGVLIIVLLGVGTLWIMANLDANMATAEDMLNLQTQR